MTPLLTVSETVAVLSGLGYTLTERQIRYVSLVPAQRWPGRNGGRLFDAVDVTLLAVFADLLARCREWELPVWSARAALTYRGDELRRAIVKRSARFLQVDPARGAVTLSNAREKDAYAIDVQALAGRVRAAARDYRALEPDIWTGAQRVPLRELTSV
jgi:hypothetical protein